MLLVCNIEFKNTISDQYMLASKIKDDAYVSYYSALEYYGVKQSVIEECRKNVKTKDYILIRKLFIYSEN